MIHNSTFRDAIHLHQVVLEKVSWPVHLWKALKSPENSSSYLLSNLDFGFWNFANSRWRRVRTTLWLRGGTSWTRPWWNRWSVIMGVMIIIIMIIITIVKQGCTREIDEWGTVWSQVNENSIAIFAKHAQWHSEITVKCQSLCVTNTTFPSEDAPNITQ